MGTIRRNNEERYKAISMKTETLTRDFFYFTSKEDDFIIGDLSQISASNRTFDVKFSDLANNEKLLNLLNLYYIQGNFGVTYTHQSRFEWFCGYISAFVPSQSEEMREKLITDPVVRILILTEDKLKNVIACLK